MQHIRLGGRLGRINPRKSARLCTRHMVSADGYMVSGNLPSTKQADGIWAQEYGQTALRRYFSATASPFLPKMPKTTNFM
jgi:hypothetical protein